MIPKVIGGSRDLALEMIRRSLPCPFIKLNSIFHT